MTEFTFAPGEKNIIGDRFSPSVIIFWLKTSIAASSTRIQYTTPNTLFGLIPLGADTKTIPLRNVASVDTSTKFNLGSRSSRPSLSARSPSGFSNGPPGPNAEP